MNLRLTILLPCVLLFSNIQIANSQEHDAHHWNTLIRKGVNLGNALEASEEGAWGVKLEASYFELIAAAGFDSVRIPIRWSTRADEAAPFSIKSEFFDRVDWAVKQALANKLVPIINVHHYYEIFDNPESHKERFLALWKQLAAHYKDYPETVYFEILNEPNGKLSSDLWNQYLKEALKIIRQNNPTRAVVIGPTHWNSISHLKLLELPADDRNIIATFHYYEPFKFTHQGAEWIGDKSKAWLGAQWTGSEKEKTELRSHLDEATDWAKANDRPLFMGEFGAYGKADTASRARWMAFLKSEAEKRKISWSYWEFCSGFGLYDRKTKEWRKELLKSLIPD